MLTIQEEVVSWDPVVAFPIVPAKCISGYQYSINGASITSVTMTSFTLDCTLTDVLSCAANVLIIRPIVIVGNSVLHKVIVIASICNTGNCYIIKGNTELN